MAMIELDATFGRMLGLMDGQKIEISLLLDPPLAHTVHIEPLTPADWEIIELHATFLELNLLSQIRALPNPAYESSSPTRGHALTLHLSPTSTANISVTSLVPQPPTSSPFARIAPDAEVIVAPKTRNRSSRGNGRESSRSVASTGKKSTGGRSGASTAHRRSQKNDAGDRGALFFRGIDRGIDGTWFEEQENMDNRGLRVWLDKDMLATDSLRGTTHVTVSIIRPAALLDPAHQQQQLQQGQNDKGLPAEAESAASRVVASLAAWDDAPDAQHIALSTSLCVSLGAKGLVGGIVRVEAAPAPVSRSAVNLLKIFPFSSPARQRHEGLKFGGESKLERDEAARQFRSLYGEDASSAEPILQGPLTDGLALGEVPGNRGWLGGLLRFDPIPPDSGDAGKATCTWILGSDHNLRLDVQSEIPKPLTLDRSLGPGEPVCNQKPDLVGIDSLVRQLTSHLSHSSSVLLTGALGSGKTSLAQLLGHNLRRDGLYHISYLPCRKVFTEESRVATIKISLSRLFMAATWGARLGGRALVVLDDLDRLCPVETELQIGGENGRSRQISELVGTIVRQYCSIGTGVVLLATAQSKDALNNVMVGGHVVREIVSLKAPDKQGRRRVLERVVIGGSLDRRRHSTDQTMDDAETEAAWMDGDGAGGRPGCPVEIDGFTVHKDLDFLELAGQTDGYMPGDLVLLVSRARSEAIIRSVEASQGSESESVNLAKLDFERAIKGFTPASLRNVTLQSSTTTFASIGGLYDTRKILLETLQYPTTYAPIFANCPLRLRSGLLLYGYPGCGKTLLASAVAGECGLNFISVKGPEILNKYIGASEKSVRDLFERAESARPCVLFFDEFDSIAPKRGHDSTGVTDRVVNQLLTQMDGAEGLSGVYVLAATSRPDLIDPALLRPGRLDKSLFCDLPSYDDRLDILRALSSKLKMAGDVLKKGLPEVASRTDGYSGADLQALVYNTQLEAIHNVLGDRSESTVRAKAGNKAGAEQGSEPHSRDFLSFKFGEAQDKREEDEDEEEEEREKAGYSRNKWLAERTAITAKLEAIKQARRRQRQLRLGSEGLQDRGLSNGSVAKDEEDEEVVIGWTHMLASLSTTRASISAEERRRLAHFYRDFVVGRSGEMPNGQGPTEVGGRSSLM